MTIDQPLADVTGSATLQMPQQAAPIDRTAVVPPGAGSDISGVEANTMLSTWGWDDKSWSLPQWSPGNPFIA